MNNERKVRFVLPDCEIEATMPWSQIRQLFLGRQVYLTPENSDVEKPITVAISNVIEQKSELDYFEKQATPWSKEIDLEQGGNDILVEAVRVGPSV